MKIDKRKQQDSDINDKYKKAEEVREKRKFEKSKKEYIKDFEKRNKEKSTNDKIDSVITETAEKTKKDDKYSSSEILNRGSSTYKTSLLRIGFSILISWYIFLYDGYDFINPSGSIGVDILDDLLSISYKYEDLFGWLFFIVAIILIYKLSNILFGWGKYTKLALAIDTKFRNVYNFHLSNNNKNQETTIAIAYAVTFEECRKNYLQAGDLEYLLKNLDKRNSTYMFLHQNLSEKDVDFNVQLNLYSKYNNFRAMSYKPLLSVILSLNELSDGPLDKEMINTIKIDYEKENLISSEANL